MRRYELKHSNDNDAPRVVTGCFGLGQQRGSVDNNVSSVDNNDTKEEMKNEENKKEDEEDSSVIRQQLSDVINEKEASQMFFRFMTKHDKRVREEDSKRGARVYLKHKSLCINLQIQM